MSSGRKFGSGGEVPKILEYAEVNGWSVRRSRNNHLQLRKPGAKTIFCPNTPSCHRAWLNVMAELKREDRALAQNAKQSA